VAQLVKVQNFGLSRDGFGAGENQTFERPFGHADPGDMFAWAGATASWPNRTDLGGSRGLDDYFTRDFANNIGAEIMGRNKFSPLRGPWRDHEWQGWWGDEPPFHTPVLVMTHHERPSFTLSDTTFHFVNGDPATVRAGPGGRPGQGCPARRRGDHHPAVPRRRPRRHPPCGGFPAGGARRRIAPVGVARRAARPVPP
jgi:dihydrofolate reductase